MYGIFHYDLDLFSHLSILVISLRIEANTPYNCGVLCAAITITTVIIIIIILCMGVKVGR